MGIRIVLEVAPKRTFASALDWPGWSRSGRTDDEAVDALLDHLPRYADVAKRAKLAVPARPSVDIVERVVGGGGTEFGVPGVPAAVEDEPLSTRELERMVSLLEACWAAFDSAARRAAGVELTKGPRGGGRDLDKMTGHVREAEVAYLSQLGSRAPGPDKPMTRLRRTFTDALAARATGAQIADPSRTRKLWSPRYATRRAAWHVLDHAWEIENRAGR